MNISQNPSKVAYQNCEVWLAQLWNGVEFIPVQHRCFSIETIFKVIVSIASYFKRNWLSLAVAQERKCGKYFLIFPFTGAFTGLQACILRSRSAFCRIAMRFRLNCLIAMFGSPDWKVLLWKHRALCATSTAFNADINPAEAWAVKCHRFRFHVRICSSKYECEKEWESETHAEDKLAMSVRYFYKKVREVRSPAVGKEANHLKPLQCTTSPESFTGALVPREPRADPGRLFRVSGLSAAARAAGNRGNRDNRCHSPFSAPQQIFSCLKRTEGFVISLVRPLLHSRAKGRRHADDRLLSWETPVDQATYLCGHPSVRIILFLFPNASRDRRLKSSTLNA